MTTTRPSRFLRRQQKQMGRHTFKDARFERHGENRHQRHRNRDAPLYYRQSIDRDDLVDTDNPEWFMQEIARELVEKLKHNIIAKRLYTRYHTWKPNITLYTEFDIDFNRYMVYGRETRVRPHI